MELCHSDLERHDNKSPKIKSI
uniref:Uncharacterized protein n=1 Tax=Anguilla anguilla TaxID=7936 RepID=A0A0E9U7W9_ANGAN